MGGKVKIKITFHFLPLRVTFGAFSVRSLGVDCGRSREPFEALSEPSKRPLILLHFYAIFTAVPQERINNQVRAYDWPRRWWRWNETTKAHLAEFSG